MYTFIRCLIIQELGMLGFLNGCREYGEEVEKQIVRTIVLGSCPADELCY